MLSRRRLLAALALPLLGAVPARAVDDEAALAFFEAKVRPILVDNCYTCHSADTNAKGGLRVDDGNGLLAGGDSGPAVVPGKPGESLLLRAVRQEGDLKMPPKARLTDEQVADLTRWVEAGAAWPKPRGSGAFHAPDPAYAQLRAEHWAWQPLREVAPPAVRDDAWPRDDIDRYILARLDGAGLAPVADAPRATLIRRATFDLTGLPPAPEAVDAFLADAAPDAFERVVDGLLESPAFGERWGRHWLDVARYGESTGSSRNLPLPQAWRYRDYVIRSVDADKPFDQFLREQVAGDLLPAASQAERDEHAVATSFLALGVKDVNQRFKVRYVMDNVDEQIDTVTRSALGLTVSCARCHDHKFDPIPTADYYALAGIFRSTDLCAGLRNKMGGGGLDYYDPSMLIPLGGTSAADPALASKVEAATKVFEKAKREFEAVRWTPEGLALGPNGRPKQQPFRQRMNRAQAELLALTDPANGEVALGVRDAKVVADTEIRLRGEAEKLGPVVPRGFLSLLDVPGSPPVNRVQSGRLELAAWLTSPSNPLTPRVMVNRAWAHLIGRGIVSSVDNFGTTGDAPTHPELLDHLAGRFVRGGWSVKKLVRAIVLSRTYRLGPEVGPAQREADPSNRLAWRHAPRRLDAEEIRDAMLAASGAIEATRPDRSPAAGLKVVELRNNGPEAARFAEQAAASRHRSVYLPLLRGLVPRSLEVFDAAEQGMVAGSREATTVAPQALYLLNDPFVRRRALDLAERLLSRSDLDDPGRIGLAYRLTLGREPGAGEVSRAARYLDEVAPELPAASDAPEPASAVAVAAPEPPKPAPPANPDEVVAEEVRAEEEVSRPRDARAAWASLCQALFGSAEFRYIE